MTSEVRRGSTSEDYVYEGDYYWDEDWDYAVVAVLLLNFGKDVDDSKADA